jgi:2-hydroxy-6-oxonona-2,4-dienedioate hydrolase
MLVVLTAPSPKELPAVIDHVSIWSDLLDVPLRQFRTEANGITTRVLEAGDPASPPLVFVHGTGGHLEAYSRNVRDLAKDFRLVLYDMAGHGYSDKPDRPYTIDFLSDHLKGLLDALELNTAHLSGESLGGWVAAWTAAHHPGRVDRLILNTPGNITNKPEVMERVKESSLQAVREATVENVRSRVEWLFYDKSMVTDELVAVRRRIYTQPGFERAMENIVAVQDWEIREPFAWGPEWCGRISVPTLLLWTNHDPTGGLDEADLLKEWIPGSELYVIDGAGHWPQWEKPAEFNSVHVNFLLKGQV